ncbi:amidohydrolase family protein [Streptantibioticus parmotrematis]|uniref:amidohydrolase family protein n=1 Tax=Streptantibioticus parmotrematis TaxID=2873249 RepID=UPI003409BB12
MGELLVAADRVVTGRDGECVTDGAVLVRDGLIAAVGPRAEVERAAPDAPVREFPGGTVLPGLIDAHVHLAFDASADPVGALRDADDETVFKGMAERAARAVAAGVTTVRDLGDRNGLALRLRAAIDSGRLPGPRVVSAGTPLTSPGGHCWFLGGEAEGPEALRALVRRNADAGAEVIKVMATGGGLTKGGPATWQAQFTADDLRVVVEEADRAGLPVAVHAHGTDGIEAAVAAGVATIEHCTWMGPDGGFDRREELLERIKAAGIHVCTAASPNWRAFAAHVGPERAAELFSSVRWMAHSGVRLIAGTDAGVPRAEFDKLADSLAFYAHLGVPAPRLVDMATADAADALRVDDVTGRLAAGHRADVLAVDGDPLTDVAALGRVRLVLARGREI